MTNKYVLSSSAKVDMRRITNSYTQSQWGERSTFVPWHGGRSVSNCTPSNFRELVWIWVTFGEHNWIITRQWPPFNCDERSAHCQSRVISVLYIRSQSSPSFTVWTKSGEDLLVSWLWKHGLWTGKSTVAKKYRGKCWKSISNVCFFREGDSITAKLLEIVTRVGSFPAAYYSDRNTKIPANGRFNLLTSSGTVQF